ncbi:MAG: family peptidase [Bradyrhizobium sp.]|nr:family peptidase [Bradyrhizobium sp.]
MSGSAAVVSMITPGSGLVAETIFNGSPINFGPDDYFKLFSFREIQISPDGESIVFAIQGPPSETLEASPEIWLAPSSGGTPGRRLALPAGCRDFKWVTSGRIAFIGDVSGRDQVGLFDTAHGSIRWITDASDPVRAFSMAHDGATLAYATAPPVDLKSTVYAELRSGDEGVLFDTDALGLDALLWPTREAQLTPRRSTLWVRRLSDKATPVPVPGDPGAFYWSDDGTLLSVTFVSDDIPAAGFRTARTSLGLALDQGQRFELLFHGTAPRSGEAGVLYSGGEWVEGSRQLLVRRARETDPWVSRHFIEWKIVDPLHSATWSNQPWTAAETYDDWNARPHVPVSTGGVLSEDTVAAHSSLYSWTTEGTHAVPLGITVEGSKSNFSFSRGQRAVAFVKENLSEPPEIYVNKLGHAKRITNKNRIELSKIAFKPREIEWKSSDGTNVHGWLMEPSVRSSHPIPLITYIHGGPFFAFNDAFAPHFQWPHPLEALASNGIAIFIPNYRGTASFGRSFQTPKAIEKEPIEDILAGLSFLLDSGYADSRQLGIAGHSHGTWLGAMVMTKFNKFRASALAEGIGDKFVAYQLSSTQVTSEVQDIVNAVNPYESPGRLIDLSPDLKFDEINTANLFEAGAFFSVPYMIGLSKASKKANLPTEFVVYPRTGHTITDPRLRRESCHRIFDWFRFWLLDVKDPDPAKATRYRRWESMKGKARLNGDL